MIQIGTLFVSFGVAIIAFRNGFANPFALIAAGAALITVGAAIKGFASKIASGNIGAGTTDTAADTGPLEFTVPLSSISPRQGIADEGLGETLDRLNSNLSRIEAQDGVLIVKDGVRRGGGLSAFLTGPDRQQLTQKILGKSTLNSF